MVGTLLVEQLQTFRDAGTDSRESIAQATDAPKPGSDLRRTRRPGTLDGVGAGSSYTARGGACLYCDRVGTPAREEPMILISDAATRYPPDATELSVPDAESARVLLEQGRPDVLDVIRARRGLYHDAYGVEAAEHLERTERAVVLGVARLAVRHGTLGNDFHAYHNEDHALEILDRRLGQVIDALGVQALPGRDWLVLSLFATCHDLRQREHQEYFEGIGANELASIAETHRILDCTGFDRTRDASLYDTTEIMIAGSTFDPTPKPAGGAFFNSAEAARAGGALAPKLSALLERREPDWQAQPALTHALFLAHFASDLDTANVGEEFHHLAESAERLASEREMRSSRELDEPASGPPVLGFLTSGQVKYFFELHRFCSDLGTQVFALGKRDNAPRVRELSGLLQDRFGALPAESFSGNDVIAAQREFVSRL